MKTAAQTREILDALESQHPGADTELDYRTPFELLVATILSAQSTDARVNLVPPALFKKYSNAAALGKAMPKDRWTRRSDTLILHGRRICRPKPLCDQCAVRDDCDYYRLVIAKARAPKRVRAARR